RTIGTVDLRDQLGLEKLEEVRHSAAGLEEWLRLPVGALLDVGRREVAGPVRVGDGDHDHFRNQEDAVDTGAEEVEEPGHRMEVGVAVEEIEDRILLR